MATFAALDNSGQSFQIPPQFQIYAAPIYQQRPNTGNNATDDSVIFLFHKIEKTKKKLIKIEYIRINHHNIRN